MFSLQSLSDIWGHSFLKSPKCYCCFLRASSYLTRSPNNTVQGSLQIEWYLVCITDNALPLFVEPNHCIYKRLLWCKTCHDSMWLFRFFSSSFFSFKCSQLWGFIDVLRKINKKFNNLSLKIKLEARHFLQIHIKNKFPLHLQHTKEHFSV